MELFYTEPEQIGVSSAKFDRFESKHIVTTLRKKAGDELRFTDGLGNVYHGVITQTKPELTATYKKMELMPEPMPKVHLAIGFIKQTRMDIAIEKCTELGVRNFYLFAGEHSNYYSNNVKRWQKITRQALKQSMRYYLPQVTCFKNFRSVLDHTSTITKRIISLQSADNTFSRLNTYFGSGLTSDIVIFIGPEGGFSQEEIQSSLDHNCFAVTFGSGRLRSETAAIAAIAGLNLIIYNSN
jgi:16S rRNA (uracil1498-N3)-methyltransferase